MMEPSPGLHQRDRGRWRVLAACKGAGLDPFFGQGAQHDEGLAYCRRCPVVEPCLWEAIGDEAEARYAVGIRGGRTAPERTKLLGLPASVVEARFAEALAAFDQQRRAEVA